MVAIFDKELLSWYLITLKLRENISHSDPSTSSNPPSTAPTIPIPSSQPQILPLTNGESHHVPQLVPDPNQNPNQELKEETLVHVEHAPTQNPGIRTAESLPVPIPRSPCDAWVILIQQKLQEANHAEANDQWQKLSIYRVPKSIRERDEQSYVPQMVSIGPFHHGKPMLKEMEPHKWRAVNRVLKRTGHDIYRYINAIRPLEERVRSCYEGQIPMSSDEFLLSLVLDGIFVLELFMGANRRLGFVELGYSKNDPVFAMRGAMHAVQRDMIMLENQMPLFVLDRLLATQLGKPDQPARVAKMAVWFFDPLMPTDVKDWLKMQPAYFNFDPLSEVGYHCLDAFRRSLLRTNWREVPRHVIWRHRIIHVADKRRQQFIHCVSELRKAGIRFSNKKTDKFWDIHFDNNGTLQIPRILIHDGTKSLFLNLIAFEQCHLDTSSNTITSYVIFMDNLIKTEEDVRYLHKRGIIEHWLGNDKEVADLFSRLCQEVVFDFNNSYLSGLSEGINMYYHSRWNRRLYTLSSTLKKNYFSNPWAFISFVAAVILLLLTFTQTFYSVYAYYRPP
ncbi:hypothetical protein LUZ61_019748 [Rhynchospora tenuis]|uniref:Uncharacterized protein n=1 Tax=Rhynchospora tenuis TaxID=198213 RepID=A0AAD5ZC10_9POAL|nr:hypothetical protein LUZ61_019748 [Rhynchospora tenuis]